jgi:hypothetical protein
MTAHKVPTPQPIRMLYCPRCQLATRASCERCLHCGRNLSKVELTRMAKAVAVNPY